MRILEELAKALRGEPSAVRFTDEPLDNWEDEIQVQEILREKGYEYAFEDGFKNRLEMAEGLPGAETSGSPAEPALNRVDNIDFVIKTVNFLIGNGSWAVLDRYLAVQRYSSEDILNLCAMARATFPVRRNLPSWLSFIDILLEGLERDGKTFLLKGLVPLLKTAKEERP